ncbi:MAG: DUF2796 domain-containing protein [Propionivibrio sp.]|nr:DUF2796 domain-containing protein [Propionivibrio sp.]
MLGFERAPRNERERQAVRRMTTQLNDSATQFQPSPAAGCMPLDSRLEALALGKDFRPSASTRPGEGQVARENVKPHAHAVETGPPGVFVCPAARTA